MIRILHRKTVLSQFVRSLEVMLINLRTPGTNLGQSLTSEELMQYIAQEHWQCCKSIHYQTWSRSRRLVTYISLVTAFSLFNPGKCVQFGRNCKVLEIVFPRCETEAKRCQGRPDSKIVHGCWNGWSCMPSSFSKWRSTMGTAVWEAWNRKIHRGDTVWVLLTDKKWL